MFKNIYKHYKKIFLIGIIFILFPIFCNSLTVPKLTSFVTDNANLFTLDQKINLENRLQNIEKNTTNQFVVLTIKSLETESLEDYSLKVARENGIGQKDKNNGLLILVSKDDRKIRIEVGYRLEEFVTDAKSSYIIRNIISPKFKENKYYEGLDGAVNEIEKLTIDKNYLNDKTINSFNSSNFWKFIFTGDNIWILLFILFIIFGIIISIFKFIYKLSTGKRFDNYQYKSMKEIKNNAPNFWKWLFIIDFLFRNNNKRGKGGGFGGWGGGGFGGGFSGGGGGFGGGGSSGKW